MQVLNDQTMTDITIQEYGTLDKLFDLARGIGKGITDDLVPGEVLEVPVLVVTPGADKARRKLKLPENKPASRWDGSVRLTGIDFMQIENDFIVS